MNDYTVIMGTTIFYSAIFILVIFIVDILYGIIDPRIRLAGGKNDERCKNYSRLISTS